ncbi:hypothetical protein ACHAXS_011925 [Conticribra weissflogii]
MVVENVVSRDKLCPFVPRDYLSPGTQWFLSIHNMGHCKIYCFTSQAAINFLLISAFKIFHLKKIRFFLMPITSFVDS